VFDRTASTPRHTTVETEEASSRNEVPPSAARGISPEARLEVAADQPGSTSSSTKDVSEGADLDIGTGRDAEGDSLRVSAASVCTSSSLMESRGERVGDADCSRSCQLRLRERTTSPLQMGHVRRRVTSQGVLLTSDWKCRKLGGGYLHAIRMELVTTREAHDLTYSVDVFL
jgi:hypothetical protein